MTPESVRSEVQQVEFPTPSADATGDANVAVAGQVGAGVGEMNGTAAVGGAKAFDAEAVTTSGAFGADGGAGAPLAEDAVAALPADQFTRVAKALADPRRFGILEIIAAHGEIACQRLCAELPVKQATVSHHVKELVAAGLVETRRDGQFVYYRYVPTVMRQYCETLAHRVAA